MAVGYPGVIADGRIVLDDGMHLPDGMRVVVLPHEDPENEWLTVAEAAERHGVPAKVVNRWVESGRVRALPTDDGLVNASDVEDAAEQRALYEMTMRAALAEEDE